MAVILVAGGTGFIGSPIVQHLGAKGHQVIIMSRTPSRARALPAGVQVRTGDVGDPASLRQALTGVDVVVNAVQFPNHPVENPRKGYTYMEVDGKGTVRLVEAAKAAGVKRFIYLSGAGARPGRAEPWFRAKEVAEGAIIGSGLAYTIFRPSWVYGPEDRSLNKFVTFARLLPFIPVIGNGRTKVQPVYVDDLAEAVAQSVENAKAVNRIYEVGGPEELTMDQIITTMLRTMGKRKPLLHSPRWFMKLATAPMTLLPTPPLSPGAVDFVLMEEPVDNAPLLADFSLHLRPLAEGLRYLARP